MEQVTAKQQQLRSEDLDSMLSRLERELTALAVDERDLA
jgi:hypothetical protein